MHILINTIKLKPLLLSLFTFLLSSFWDLDFDNEKLHWKNRKKIASYKGILKQMTKKCTMVCVLNFLKHQILSA